MADDRENESVGMWLRRRRKALDLTQAALADCVGCADVTIRRLEAGAQRPSRQIAERLARCLEIDPAQRTVFLQVARGERPVAHLSPASIHRTQTPPASVEVLNASLPRDTVPPPAPLPAGSRMPLSRNPLFVGRESDLLQLAAALHAGRTAAIGQVEIAAATGLGGIGKTQLACEFVHRYGQFFPGGVFWLSFADPAAVPVEVAAGGGVDGMKLSPDFDTLPLDAQIQRVLAAWKEPLPRLLVFDNCEDEALLAQWRPAHGGCRVLLTSRRHHWDAALGVQAVSLDVLPRAESIALLRQFRPDLSTDHADLDAIAATLGDLPLALHLAGSFLAKYRHALTPAQYGARLHTPTLLDDRSLQAAGLSPTQHVQHVARTFEQSYARLDSADPTDALARTLLAHAAYCAPGEPIPRWLLRETLHLPADGAGGLLVEDALTRLIDLGLLATDAAGSLRLHRLVVVFVQAVLGDAAVRGTVEATMLRVADDLNTRWNPQPLLTVQPHLRFLTEAAQPRADARTAEFCHALGYHLWQLGTYAEAQRAIEQAIAIRQRVLGEDHPQTANSLLNLGNVLADQGQYAEAQRAIEQAIAIRQRVLGVGHPDTAQSLRTLGDVRWSQGHYAEAQRYLEQALAIHEQVLGADHPQTALSLSNLGWVLHDQGRYTEAQRYGAQALAICERVLGADHHVTAQSLIVMGWVRWSQGYYAEAQRYLEQALAILERVLGADHHIIAQNLYPLGRALWSQGHYAEAQDSIEQAVAIWQRVLGDDHLQTATGFDALGMVLMDQGRCAAAQGYIEQAVAIRQRVLGDDHPDTAASLHNLGGVFHAHGQYAEAQDYLERAFSIRQRVLEASHPDIGRSLRALGELRHAQGETAQARRSLEQALAIFAQRLGTGHPDTAESLHQLGRVLHTQGQDAEARRSIEQALTIYEQAVGAEHLSTQRVRASLAAILDHQQER